mmetsp:Transcript_42988/g.31391  ORF Transcript_42988/g.31391 Transcript_42988/m.31391 type:complete len:85 (+) Transcript_42988:227-481(+)
MVAIIRNSYQEDFTRATIDSLKSSLSQKKLKHGKDTYAEKLRVQANKKKYTSLTRNNSISIPKLKSKGSGTHTRNFVMKGVNLN